MTIEQDGVGELGTPPPAPATQQVADRKTGAAFVYNDSGTQDPLIVDSVRSIACFGGAQTGYPLLILGAYAALGILLSMLLCALKPRPKSG